MRNFGFLQCATCEKAYKGEFKISTSGVVTCIDCNSPTIFKDKLPLKSRALDSEMSQEVVLNMLTSDVDEVYTQFLDKGKLPLDLFTKSNGDIDAHMVYFQNNPLDICVDMQVYAYMCLSYLELNLEKNYKFAKNFVESYINLRNYKFSDLEMSELSNLVNSAEMREILYHTEGDLYV